MEAILSEQAKSPREIRNNLKLRSDVIINYFLGSYFIFGLILAYFYDTWFVAIGIGGLSLFAYYFTKFALPNSTFYQYILSIVLGIFMAQYIYQMHGLFEMHFIAFIGSAILITYHNWKLQLPIALAVVAHHGIFGYLQYSGVKDVYFTELEFMNLLTFIIHVLLAASIFFICGLWSHQFEIYHKRNILQTIQIEKSNEELRKTNMELDKFVYSVSHDLRAPLSSVLGVIEIAEETTEESIMIEQLGLMKGSIHKLDKFILDILSYSRNSRLEIKNTKVVFKDMLNEITNNLKYMNRTPISVDLKIDIDETGAFKSDESSLNIVLNNLISNAIRYSNPETTAPYVQVTVNANNELAKIKIKDNGIGIKKDHHDKIFNMFYRISDASEGSGLGLYIVKEAVEKLNGQIILESEPGIGTEFTLIIPGKN